MSLWTPDTHKIIDNGFGESRYGTPINGIVAHHVGGKDGLKYVANENSRDSHPTYHISNSGVITGIVNPERRPHSTGVRPDIEAVTVEIDNKETGGEWPVSDAALEAFIEICLWHESQSERKGFALNKPGQAQTQFFIAWHSQYTNTQCPGKYVTDKLPGIVDKLNNMKIKGTVKLTPKPTPKPTTKLHTTTEQDGIRGKNYWTMVQAIGRKQGLYGNAYKIDGVPGAQTHKVETILTARLLNNLNLGKRTTANQDGNPYNGSPKNYSNFIWMIQKNGHNRRTYTGAIDGIIGPLTDKEWARYLAGWLNRNI